MRFELMIDLQTAKSLGPVVTASIMLRADEVIEYGAALLRLLTAAFGTKRTCRRVRYLSAFRGKAEISCSRTAHEGPCGAEKPHSFLMMSSSKLGAQKD
jgi:hypothetical protein